MKKPFQQRLILMILTAIFCTAGLLHPEYAAAADGARDIKVKCKGAVVMDAKTGTLLYAKDAGGRYYPASTTKLMTALVALEHCSNLQESITASDNAVHGIDPESSHIALDVGEKLTMEQALYALLLASANDAAVAIAESTAGSVKQFAEMMNQKARELGLTGSHFVNPHGLYHKDHYVTPRDMAVIMRACLNNPEFVKIFTTIKYTIPKTNKSKKRVLWNNHRMVKYKYYYHPAVIGGKSGYVTKSRFNLVTVGEMNNMDLIIVTMRGNTAVNMVKDTRKLLNYYLEHDKTISVPSSASVLQLRNGRKIPVTDRHATFDVIVPKQAGTDQIHWKTHAKDNISFPIQKGKAVGTIQAIYQNQVVGTATLYAAKTVDGGWHQTMRWVLVAVIAAAIVLITLFLCRLHSKQKTGNKKPGVPSGF